LSSQALAGGALHPATDAATYRQKAQRSFAAELLSPFSAVDDMLEGDYSEDRQDDVAEHFNVSPRTINTLLKNHGRLDRDDSEQDFDVTAAA
jgi:Zn-dependent peptidase ImmA (M78 family)